MRGPRDQNSQLTCQHGRRLFAAGKVSICREALSSSMHQHLLCRMSSDAAKVSTLVTDQDKHITAWGNRLERKEMTKDNVCREMIARVDARHIRMGSGPCFTAFDLNLTLGTRRHHLLAVLKMDVMHAGLVNLWIRELTLTS